MPQLPFRKASSYHDVPPVTWLARPWIVQGSITEIIGTQKDAGKTTMIMRGLVAAILTGGTFLGQRVMKGPVIYFTENPPIVVRKDLEKAGIMDHPDLYMLQWHDVPGTDWKTLMTKLRADVKELGAVLVVVDTLSHFALGIGESENDTNVAIEIVKPLIRLASEGVSVLTVRHEPKVSGRSPAKAGRGASAFSGAVDIVLRLRRKGGAVRPGIRILEGRGRFEETPEETIIELTPTGYIQISKKGGTDPIRDAILAALVSGALSLPDLVDTIKQKKSILASALDEMITEGIITQNGSAALPRFHLKEISKDDQKAVDNT